MDDSPTRRAAPPILPLTMEGVGFEAGGKRLIKNISLRLEAGPRTVVLGPNGAGKSLLLNLCHGLIAPGVGRIDWAGWTPSQARHWQAMVFQRPVLLRRSAGANVAYALAVKGVPRSERGPIVRDVLVRAGLRRAIDKPARVLSGGEQQRLVLARAIALRPQVLFLDEPTSNLDVASAAAVEDLIRAIHQDGAKIIMTTHDLGQARRLADEVLFMHKGRLIEHAPAERFFGAPRSAEAAAFIEGKLLK